MRLFDTMFARTAWLILAVVIALCLLLIAVQRNATVLPAMRSSAAALAALIQRDETLRDEARAIGPPRAGWRDRLIARSAVWRTFADELREQLGPGTQLELRSAEAGPVIWARVPGTNGWISRQMDLPRGELRGAFLAVVVGIVVAILLAAALLARQLTGPLRRLASQADRIRAGNAPIEQPSGAPAEVRQVQEAFTRLWQGLRSAEQERESLLAGVSHDLRTPIGRMRLAVGLYGDGANPQLLEELEHDLAELEQAAAQFIGYARSNYEEPAAPAVLDAIVAEAVGARALAAGESPKIDWQGAASQPLMLEARNVRRVVDNLLDNAVRHGRAPVQVRTEQRGGVAALVVRDAGPGICAENQRAALQPFVRLARTDASGSGLGLAIVDRIARRHGGQVTMATVPEGFEVRVTFASASGKNQLLR
jgi:two-component system, OmpR family, osmolarity sensor histidine kinase EnvZ